jgi:hypothetical protein
MMYMNRWDIDDAVALARCRCEDTPVLLEAAETLERLADWADSHSDGWAYWPKPCRAAKSLQELISSVDRYAPADISREDLNRALRPVKAFLTRQGVDHSEVIR